MEESRPRDLRSNRPKSRERVVRLGREELDWLIILQLLLGFISQFADRIFMSMQEFLFRTVTNFVRTEIITVW